MIARCDFTDLLVDSCAHCLGHRLGDEPGSPEITVERTFAAQYDGRCAIDASHAIEAGDIIGATDHGWACTGCVEKAATS